MKRWSHWISLAAFALGLASNASATLVTYSDRNEWLLQVNNVSTVDFTGPAPGGIVYYNTDTGYQSGGITFVGTFSASNYLLFNKNAGPSESWYDWGSGAILVNSEYSASFPRSIRVTLPADQYAFGVDLMTGNDPGQTVTVRINGGAEFTVPTFVRPTRAFFGVISDTPITQIEVFNPPPMAYLMMDNFSIGQVNAAPPPAETPEAATLLLCGSGLCLLAWTARWKQLRTA